LRAVLIVLSFLKNLKKMNEWITSYTIKKFGQEPDAKKAIGSIQVVILTLSIYIFLLMILTAVTLVPGFGG
jgi:hypothetical protein